jgi:hypothetical protein
MQKPLNISTAVQYTHNTDMIGKNPKKHDMLIFDQAT